MSRYSLFSRLSAIERIMTVMVWSCQWNSNNGNPDCQYRVYTIFPIWNFMTPGTLNNPMTNFIKVYFFLIKYVLGTVYCLNKSMFKLYVKKMRNAPHTIFFFFCNYDVYFFDVYFDVFVIFSQGFHKKICNSRNF